MLQVEGVDDRDDEATNGSLAENPSTVTVLKATAQTATMMATNESGRDCPVVVIVVVVIVMVLLCFFASLGRC